VEEEEFEEDPPQEVVAQAVRARTRRVSTTLWVMSFGFISAAY